MSPRSEYDSLAQIAPQSEYDELGSIAPQSNLKKEDYSELTKIAPSRLRQMASNLGAAAADIGKGVVSGVESIPHQAYQSIKLFQGTPQEKLEAATDLIGQAIPVGRQMAKDVEAPWGSEESFRGLGQAALMALPALKELRTSPKPVAQATSVLGQVPPVTQPQVPPLPTSAFGQVGAITGNPAFGMLGNIGTRLNNYRRGFQALFQARPARDKIASSYDAIDNQAAIAGQQAGNSVRLEVAVRPMDDEAMTPIVEANGDRAKLIADATKVVNSTKAAPEFKRIYQYAVQNFDRLNPKRSFVDDLHKTQLLDEHAHGIDTDSVDGYVAHRYDMDLLTPGKPLILDATGGRGAASAYFRKQRVFADYAEAISQGYTPRTLSISRLADNRIRAGQRIINQRQWVNILKNEKSPIDGSPIVTDLIKQPKGTFVAPRGYVYMEPVQGVRVAVNEHFAPIIDALTGKSHFPQILSKAEAGVKHGVLLFDTFHASRLSQMQMALKGVLKPSYRKGLTLLEYANKDLDAAVKNNEITVDMANYARANRPTMERLVKSGLNVGQISDALFKDVVRGIPGISRYTKWLFDKFNRGIIADSGIYIRERNARLRPQLSEAELDRLSAKETNTYYRNLRSQGIFKRKTFQDAARFFLLAPQWLEGMVTSELKGYGQALRVPYDAATKGKLVVGNLAKGMGTGIVAYFAANQLINLFTRGKFTWENPEKGKKLDAWIPDSLGGSAGYFLNPMSVFGELTHDLMKYGEQFPNKIDVATKIATNKLSPVSRAMHDLTIGKDFLGRPLDTTFDRVMQAAIDVLPVPIGARSAVAQYAGSQERTLASSLGLKLDPAPTAVRQISEMATDWNLQHGIKRPQGIPSEYSSLKAALRTGDMEQAKSEYLKLRKTKKRDLIVRYFEHQASVPFTGSKATETRFMRTLTRQELELYLQARREEQTLRQRFFQLDKF